MKKIVKYIGGLLFVICMAVLLTVTIGTKLCRIIRKEEESKNKMTEFYTLLIQWLTLKQSNNSLENYFKARNFSKVAIYGMKELGQRLYEELRNSDIEVKYIIDKNADELYAEVDIVSPDGELDEVDVIVITAIHYYDEIKEVLASKVNCPIISLEEVIYGA